MRFKQKYHLKRHFSRAHAEKELYPEENEEEMGIKQEALWNYDEDPGNACCGVFEWKQKKIVNFFYS